MPDFLIRRNYNKRPISSVIQEFPSRDMALRYVTNLQEALNNVYVNDPRIRKGVCPVVELHELIFTGMPIRRKAG